MRLVPLILLALLLPAAATGQVPPACAAATEGMTACFETKLCVCAYQPGGSLTARPPGYRWDCGIFRPSCGVVPPDTNPPQQPSMILQPFVQPGWLGVR